MSRVWVHVAAVLLAAAGGGGALYSRDDRLRNKPRLLDRACELSSCYPATGNLLIGRENRLTASSTCGLEQPERYCIVSHLEKGKKCFWCDSSNNTIHNPNLNHRIQNIIYKFYPGTRTKSWWQSESGKENVTIQLDMEAQFHLTHLIIQFKTFRPAAMFVERSYDFGKTWRVYRYFAHNCHESFPGIPTHTQKNLSEVVCESRYSAVAPSSEGEVIFRVLPPNINVPNPYSEEVQSLLRMTNLRINFRRLHTLGDDLLDDRDEIQEKYYYSIYEMTVRGSCSCYGHASQCLPMQGVESRNNMVHGRCECTHNTRGLNCEYCEDFYNDLPWQPAVGRTSNACKRCTCNNHATSCHFDPAVYNKTGKLSGGVCDDCKHNTIGVNCERCKPYFYKDPNEDIQSPEICKPCDCDPQGTIDNGMCEEETDVLTNRTAGECHCKTNIDGPRCDMCKEGYWNLDPNNPDGCEACTCNKLGTVAERGCEPMTGECICKRYVTGKNCDQCMPQFYGLSESDDGCVPCDCDVGGSLDNDCDVLNGQCKCRPNINGRRCDQPIQNFYVGPLDSIVYEGELGHCDSQIDENAIQSQLCHVVIRESYPDGRKETWTGPGFMKIPEGSTLVFVVDNLMRSMNYNVLIRYEPTSNVNWEEASILINRPPPDTDSPCANVRPEDDSINTILPANQRSVLVQPAVCLEKGKKTEIKIYLGSQNIRSPNSRASILIDSIALIPSVDDLPFLQEKDSLTRREFDHYNCADSYYYDLGRETLPELCKKYHASIGFYVQNGSEACQCDPTGSESYQCDPYTGNCKCVENIVGRRCDRCAPGTYGFSKFGCKRCDCNSIGSLDNLCDATSGQCKCRANTYGRACDLCQPGYFNFPNCQQCDCNAHANECDDKTGACIECRDYTEGHRCERCVEGFYGDPRLGVDIACRPCPCPGIKDDPEKSSHADRCELDPESKDIVCECKEGYAGPLCDVCADNYYGDPMTGYCEKCECNDNTDLTKPGNCDPYTGKCLKCLYNTAGDNCEVCQDGYFGDALQKTCFPCNCSVLGTNFTQGTCDKKTGQCPCYNHVIGINCDQCAPNHWRIALGTGCDPCECDLLGSLSPQCNPFIGKCNCLPGYGGRQCDQCEENHWGDPKVQCHKCECDPYGSADQQCMRENGSCNCQPGIGGYHCDICDRGYLGQAPSCYACGECFDNWDHIIGDLQTKTENAISNASKIKMVGATGAYTRDFDEMTKNLKAVENILKSASQGQTTVKDVFANILDLQSHLDAADSKIKESNNNLNNVTSKINIGNVTLDNIRASTEELKAKTAEMSNSATKLQEANLEGALNLTREAKVRAMKAADDADAVQSVISDTDKQIKSTDLLIERQYSNFNKTQADNDKKLAELQELLAKLNSKLPKLNEKMCGQETDSCDICGGAGCGKCGGISCDQGAVTKAEQALDFANKTENRLKEHELTAEDLFRSISQAKQDTVAVRAKSKDVLTKAVEFKLMAEKVTNDSIDLTTELRDFLSNTSNTPADVRSLANEILNLSISIEPKEITELSQKINSSVSQLTDIENIIAETKPDLERANALKQNATVVSKAANVTLGIANKVLEALDEAEEAQNAADSAIQQANNDIAAAKNDLTPIAEETEQAQKQANETKQEVEQLRTRLQDLQRNIIKIENGAGQVKQEADDVVNRAEAAEEKARQLRQDFKNTNATLTEKATQTSISRERAQFLLKRANKLASDTQTQLKQLANMEELYNDHNQQLSALEKEIGELTSQMTYYVSEITRKSDYYRTCTWLYLEPILSTDDGDLGARFRRVDQGFRQVARIIEADPRLSALAQTVRLLPMLESLAEQLNGCQSALNEYIDEKRSKFPRLYFLSDDDLLELLGQARAHTHAALPAIQTHLKKLFPGVTTVKLGPNAVSVTALCSQHGESLHLEKPVDIDCPVEVWLKQLETEMRSSLKNLTLKSVNSNLLDQDPFTMPTQILCLAQNIRFTQQTEKAITNKELYGLKEMIEQENVHFAQIQVDDENERVKKQALILQCVHYMDVVKCLIDNSVVDVSDWNWQKRLRFYVINKDVVAKMGLATISYSYEYLGVNTGQFVRTELAEECFLILTQALHLGLVGNPFGPAGTGKTESVKALGGLVGRLVLVFNCDEAMDAQCMSRLLSGLAKCGSWGCFDEFNRLSTATLAAVTHQLTALLAAILETNNHPTATAVIYGKQVTVVSGVGVMVTLNPAGVGYGGRQAVSGSLGSLLRGVCVSVPPPAPLAAPLIAPYDPTHHWTLANDLQQVFALARELLTHERHYDWGLRAVKAAVGSLTAALNNTHTHNHTHDVLLNNRAALRRVLELNNISKLTKQDAERFEAILSLVFSEVPTEDSCSNPMIKALEEAVQDLKLVQNGEQIQKCMEVYEQLQQRMGVVIVGPPGSGKSTIRKILKHALTQQGNNIVEYIICPKAMSRKCLLGNIDLDTRQWTDGVISATALEISNQSPEMWSWVVLEGVIDPGWVEALNSVLDDNRLLTLPNGHRVQFSHNVNYLFETTHLALASPATVSRMGLILLSNDIGCAPEYLQSWITSTVIENEIAKMALPVLQKVVKNCLEWLSTHKTDLIMRIYGVSMVKQILTQFSYVANNVGVSVMNTSPEELVSISIHRSILGFIKKSAVEGFKNQMGCSTYLPPVGVIDPCDGVVWGERLVPAVAALRGALLDAHTHILLVGPPASGKNVLIEELIKETNTSTIIKINCTPILEPEDIIKELKMAGVRRGGAGAVLLVTSLHRASTDIYGTSALHSILLQLIQHGGYWERGGAGSRGVTWRGAGGVRVVATVRGTSQLDHRLLNALHITTLPEPENDELLELIENYLKQNANKVIKNNELLNFAKSILNVYKETSETFYNNTHYKWFASDLKKWCENIKWYTVNSSEDFTMALISEANMIFRDRLMTAPEKSRFDSILKSHFTKGDLERLYLLYKTRGPHISFDICGKDEWYHSTQKIINQCLSEHEHNVFGDFGAEVCSELATLCPAVARASVGGVCVCVGSAGVCRVGAVQIAVTSLSATLYHLYTSDTFYTQMKNAISSAGIDNNRTIILLQEQACDSTTLGVIEGVTRATTLQALPSSVVPNNVNKDNSEQIINNVKQNLGIIISLDKNQENVMDLFDKYPYLYKDGHVVWIDRWSEDTLMEIPQLIINRLNKEHATQNSDQIDLIRPTEFVNIYNTLQEEWMTSPCRYVAFVKAYHHILNRKKSMLNERKRVLMSGVEALNRARIEVSSLQEEAALQQAALSHKQAEANLALDQISATVRAATDNKEEMHILKNKIQIENDQLQIRKKEIEAELAAVEPVIAAARAAVGDIKPESLSEVRSLRAPPSVVRDVLEGVLRLMGINDTSWHSMKTFLSRRGVREDIRYMDASQISLSSLEAVEALVSRQSTSFSPSAARRASAAVAPLAAWVTANLQYARALHDTKPLQDQQQELHRNLKKAEHQLASLSSGVLNVEQRVEELKEQLGSHSRDVATLQLSLATGQATIAAATTLLSQLQHEYATWEQDLKYISKEISELSVRSLLAAAYVVYLPDLTEPQARALISRWSSILEFDDSSFDVINFLCASETQLKWDADGLPTDRSALKNAVILHQFVQPNKIGFTPLIVDPDGDAMAWLRNTLSGTQCEFISQTSDNFHTALQYATRLGRTLVVTSSDSISPSLSNVISFPGVGAGRVVLYTRDAAAPSRLHPRFRSVISVTHYTPRLDGLIYQLVHHALQHRNPEVNEKSRDIKMKKATLQKEQYQLQENLLKDLSSNSDILHDTNLLESLKKTRETSATIAEALESARSIENEIKQACVTYEYTARKAAVLTLAVKEIMGQHPLVVLPVDVVMAVYVEAIVNVGRSAPELSNEEIVKYVTRRITERVLLSVRKKDKYSVVLHLLRQVYDHVINQQLWKYLIGDTDLVEDQRVVDDIKNNYQWIPDECVRNVAILQKSCPELFSRLCVEDVGIWRVWLRSGEWGSLSRLALSEVERAVVAAALRPDSLYICIVALVDSIIGVGSMNSGGLEETASWGRHVPLLVLGDHAHLHLSTAHTHLTQTSIEDGPAAWQSAVEECRSGGWMSLTVGGSVFTPALVTFITDLAHNQCKDLSPDFRLWILTEDREIPPAVSNCCVNVILESGEGIRNVVVGTLRAWGAGGESPPQEVRRDACLAYLHAVVMERRYYIPQGWSEWWGFGWGDVWGGRALTRGGRGGRGALLSWYGGRVGGADRPLLHAITHTHYPTHLLHTYTPPHTHLTLPNTNSMQAYIDAFSSLPHIDTPQMLGLPANCRVAWERKTATYIIEGLKDLDTAVTYNKKSNEDVNPLKPLLALWKKLMSGNPLVKGEQIENKCGTSSWWWSVVAGEVCECGRAAAHIHAHLAHTRHTPHAHIHKVPASWQLLWTGPESTSRYIRELAARANSAVQRYQQYNQNIPRELDVRSVMSVGRVLSCVRAEVAARTHTHPALLHLHPHWDCDALKPDECEVVLSGLCLEGAVWDADHHYLLPAHTHSPPHTSAPTLGLRYSKNEFTFTDRYYKMPIFSNESRQALLLHVPVLLGPNLDTNTATLNSIALFVAPI